MNRKNIFTEIENNFEYSVIGPVNPFTIDNPDALIYNNHQLIGLYVPLAKEVNNPDLLLRRVHMSRLAMSDSMSNVIILPNEDNYTKLYNNEAIISTFDKVHSFDGEEDLIKFISCDIKSRYHVDKRLRVNAMKRFWGALDYIDRHSYIRSDYRSLKCNSEIAAIRSWSNPDHNSRSAHTCYSDSCLITSKGKTKQSFKEGYDSIMSFAAMFNYSVSDGTLQMKPHSADTFMYLNIEELDMLLTKEIYLRTMLFLGYLPCTVSSFEEVKKLNEHYYLFAKERKFL